MSTSAMGAFIKNLKSTPRGVRVAAFKPEVFEDVTVAELLSALVPPTSERGEAPPMTCEDGWLEWKRKHQGLDQLDGTTLANMRTAWGVAWIKASRSATGRWKRGDQRVVCAANKDADGRIVTGARHFDAVMMEQINRSPHPDAWRSSEQGFIDQFGTFLTREEARQVAERQGQVLDQNGGAAPSLYSENLY